MISKRTYFDVMAEYLDQPIAIRSPRDDMMTKTVRATLGDILYLRLAELYMPVVQKRMCSLLADDYPLVSVPPSLAPAQARMGALLRVMDETGGGEKLRDEYPELARLDCAIRTGFENLVSEILSSLEEKHEEVSRLFFFGRDFGRVTAMRLPGRKFQRTRTSSGGRMTLLVETEGGKLYYKPHSCKTDQVFSQLTRRFFPELHAGNQTIDCGRASLAEFVSTIPLTCEADAKAYYVRMGLLAAIYFALDGKDLHSENIIPHGHTPVPIDLEVLAGHTMPDSKLEPVIEMAPKERGSMFTPLYAIADDGYGENGVEVNGYLPRVNGRMVTVEGYEDAFIAGFSDGFLRMRNYSKEIITLLEDAADAPIRVGIRNLRIYPLIINGMLQPERLRSRSARDAWLDKAWDMLPKDERALCRELEREDLLNLDYPQFYTCIGGETLYRMDGRVAIRDVLSAPLDCVRARLKLLTNECLEECVQTLRENLALE